ncbi:competence protein ComK [Anaerorhabdus sp.]|uniref:competence protein ComK n=1 Tax=Anaerorhabdus sp. TaxID=1872524 RepID=UPI002FCB7E7D
MYTYCDVIYYDTKTNETVLMKDKEEIKRLNGKPIKWIKIWCLENGSSLEGRQASFSYLCKVHQKPCILINEMELLLLLPTQSIQSEQCLYIQYRNIDKIVSLNSKSCLLITRNGYEYDLNVDARIIKKQIKRSNEYVKKLHDIQRKFIFLD